METSFVGREDRFVGTIYLTYVPFLVAARFRAPLVRFCFRYLGESSDSGQMRDAELDALNREILARLQEEGIAVPSGTTIGGRYYLHLAITNHRSRREDFDLLVREVRRLGCELGPGGKT